MRNAIAALAILAGAAAHAQSVNIQLNPNGMGMNVQGDLDSQAQVQAQSSKTEEHTENGYKIRYETNDEGKTLLRVLAPEGGHVEVFDGSNSVASEDIPMSFKGRADVFYRYVVRWPNGATFEKKFAAKSGMTMSLWVGAPNMEPQQMVVVEHRVEAPAQVGMPDGDFQSLKEAIKGESFSEEKLGVLKTAAGSHMFSADQVGQLIDLYDFSKDKLGALDAVKNRIADRNNNFKIISHFDFSGDKQAAQKLLR